MYIHHSLLVLVFSVIIKFILVSLNGKEFITECLLAQRVSECALGQGCVHRWVTQTEEMPKHITALFRRSPEIVLLPLFFYTPIHQTSSSAAIEIRGLPWSYLLDLCSPCSQSCLHCQSLISESVREM